MAEQLALRTPAHAPRSPRRTNGKGFVMATKQGSPARIATATVLRDLAAHIEEGGTIAATIETMADRHPAVADHLYQLVGTALGIFRALLMAHTPRPQPAKVHIPTSDELAVAAIGAFFDDLADSTDRKPAFHDVNALTDWLLEHHPAVQDPARVTALVTLSFAVATEIRDAYQAAARKEAMARARTTKARTVFVTTDLLFDDFLLDVARTFISHEDVHGDLYMSHDRMTEDLVRRHPSVDRQTVRALITAVDQVYETFIHRHREAN